MRKYYKGDDFNSFDQEWALIEVDIPEEWEVLKAEFKVGVLPTMTFDNPEFPLLVSLDASQTIQLKDINNCYLAIFDKENRKQTLEGSWTFEAENEVVGSEADRAYPMEDEDV